MSRYRKAAQLGLAISPTFLVHPHQAAADARVLRDAGSFSAPLAAPAAPSMDRLHAALRAMSPEEKLRLAGDRIQVAVASTECAGPRRKKTKGACCSPSVRWRCVTGEDEGGAFAASGGRGGALRRGAPGVEFPLRRR